MAPAASAHLEGGESPAHFPGAVHGASTVQDTVEAALAEDMDGFEFELRV